MGSHAAADRPEPVALASAVQAVLAALVTLGWVQLDDAAISAIATVVALAAAAGITVYTRSRVTPVSDPTDGDGAPLVPAAPTATDPLPAAKLLKREGGFRVLA